jgi:hypothetical protein
LAEEVRQEVKGWDFPVEFFYGDPQLEPEESFLKPYLRACYDHNSWLGVEELVELRLSWEAARRTGRFLPVLVGVLGIPHPYIDSASKGGDVKEIEP